jgi:hypothetical protein
MGKKKIKSSPVSKKPEIRPEKVKKGKITKKTVTSKEKKVPAKEKKVTENPEEIQQELQVLIANLNKTGQLSTYFVLRDEDVSDVDDAPLSDDDDDVNDAIKDGQVADDGQEVQQLPPPQEKKVEKKIIQTEEISSSTAEKNAEQTKKELKKKKKKENQEKKRKKEQLEKNEEITMKSEKEKIEKIMKLTNQEDSNIIKKDEKSAEEIKADYGFLKDTSSLSRPQCIIKAGEKWFEIVAQDDFDPDTDLEHNEYWMTKLEKHALKLLDNEVANFQKSSKKKSSEGQWLSTVLKSGTLTDKISAYSVFLQKSPVQNLAALATLIGMISLKSRRPLMMALDTLQVNIDMFHHDVWASIPRYKQKM